MSLFCIVSITVFNPSLPFSKFSFESKKTSLLQTHVETKFKFSLYNAENYEVVHEGCKVLERLTNEV